MKIRPTEFARFARTKNEHSKKSIVRKAQREAASTTYDVRTDFYKRPREALKRLRGPGLEVAVLDRVVTDASEKRRAHYRRVLGAFAVWAEEHRLEFFASPRAKWAEEGIEVPVNPELGMVIDGVPHVAKLNFTCTPLSDVEVAVLHQLMHEAVEPQCAPGTRMAVLDLANGRLHVSSGASLHRSRFLRRHAMGLDHLARKDRAFHVFHQLPLQLLPRKPRQAPGQLRRAAERRDEHADVHAD